MSKPKGKRATGTSEQRRDNRAVLSLITAQKMLPLVSCVVKEIQRRWNHLSQLEGEQVDLDRRRRALTWPERARRYQVAEEISTEQRELQEAVTELEQLEVALVDPVRGEVAFPTVINGRRGYFVWRQGEAQVAAWCFAHDATRHPVPASWRKEM